MAKTHTSGKIGFLFGLGHGHYAQFLNFKECIPPELAERAVWIGMRGDTSGSLMARLPMLSYAMRYRFHQHWHARRGVAQYRNWDALFFTGMQLSFISIMRGKRCYTYTDISPSVAQELYPWYCRPETAGHVRVNPLKQMVSQRLNQAMHECWHGIFAMSKWAAAGLCKDTVLGAERIYPVLPGANLNRWHYIDRSDRAANSPVRLLFVGGEFERKGGRLLLEWAEKTQAQNWELDIVTWPSGLPEWVMECLGHPKGDAHVTRSLTPRLPQVRVHSGLRANTPELMALYAQADIFCLPTQADGSSIASLEAMATGLPVLVSAVGGIPELIEDGITGILLKRNDPDDLATRLEALISDASLRQRIGCGARQSCEDYYNVERQVREIITVIDRERDRG